MSALFSYYLSPSSLSSPLPLSPDVVIAGLLGDEDGEGDVVISSATAS